MGQLCLVRKPTPIWHLQLRLAPRSGYLLTDTNNLGHHMNHTSLTGWQGGGAVLQAAELNALLPSAENTQICDPALPCAVHSHSSWAQQAYSALTRSSLYFGLLDSSFVRLKKAERELGKGRAEKMVTDIKHTFLQHKILNLLLLWRNSEHPRSFKSRNVVSSKSHPFQVASHHQTPSPHGCRCQHEHRPYNDQQTPLRMGLRELQAKPHRPPQGSGQPEF